MKKICLILTAVFMILTANTVGYASENKTINNNENNIECLSDSIYIISAIENDVNSLSKTKTAKKQKTSKYYNSEGELEWTVTITGVFDYDGKTATCTKLCASYTIYNNSWQVTASNVSKGGAQVVGDFTLTKYFLGIPAKSINKTISLTCSKDGKVS